MATTKLHQHEEWKDREREKMRLWAERKLDYRAPHQKMPREPSRWVTTGPIALRIVETHRERMVRFYQSYGRAGRTP
jgi:hypothetical protein